ncbi:MAG: DEAD/DEAH box helicase [Myxococcota bacterium]
MDGLDTLLTRVDLRVLNRKARRSVESAMAKRRAITVRDAVARSLVTLAEADALVATATPPTEPTEPAEPTEASPDPRRPALTAVPRFVEPPDPLTLPELTSWLARFKLQGLLDVRLQEIDHGFISDWYISDLRSVTPRDLLARRYPTPRAVDRLRHSLRELAEVARAGIPAGLSCENRWRNASVPGPLRPAFEHLLSRWAGLRADHANLYQPTSNVRVDLDRLALGAAYARLDLEPLHLDLEDSPFQALAGIAGLLDAIASDRADVQALADTLARPPWDRELEKLGKALARPDLADDKPLLGWRVDPDTFETLTPVRCRRTQRGTYQTRKEDPDAIPSALATEPGDLTLLDATRVRGARLVLDRLVGHPRVFLGTGNVALPVRSGQLRVGVRAVADGHVLQAELDGQALAPHDLQELLRTRSGGFVLSASDDAIRVIRVPNGLGMALDRLAPSLGKPFHTDATAGLRALLPTLASQLPLAVDPSLRGRAVEGDTRPVFRLSWDGESLGVGVRVRPLPEVTAEIPGQGPETVLGERQGEVVHVQRDLPAEAADAEALCTGLELPGGRGVGFEWTLQRRDDALALVRRLQAVAEQVQVAWNGQRVRVVDEARTADLSLRVSTGSDWLGLDGGVSLQGHAVELRELLRAALEGYSHVQVAPGQWVALEATLQASLATAASVGMGKQSRVSALHAPLLSALEAAGASIGGSTDWRSLVERAEASVSLEAPVPTGLEATLRAYQLVGYRWLAALSTWAPGACLADDMGLGKTLQALALLLHRADHGPALVVAPTSVCVNWEREGARFAPGLTFVPYRGSDREDRLQGLGAGQVVVVSYGVLIRDIEALEAVAFDTVVLDEAQAIKNASTARARAATRLKSTFRLALSGTPVENHTGELFSLMDFVAPGLLGSATGFRERFAVPIDAHGDRDRRALLARLVGPFVLRRTKKLVAADLPARIEQVYRIQPSDEERTLYERTRLEALVRASAPGAQPFQILAELQRLRQLACHPRMLDPGSPVPSSKLRAVRRLLADLKASGHRALVFSSFTKHLALVREALEAEGLDLRYLDGTTSVDARQQEVDAFQDGRGDAFLISLKAGGTGLNLTAASYVIHLDPWWNPAAEDQATDRAHRIGQTQAVTVYRMVTVGTVEEQIVALHDRKRELAEALLSGSSDATRITADELLALLSDANADTSELDVLSARIEPPPPAPASPDTGPTTATVADFVQRYCAELDASELTSASRRAYKGALTRLAAERSPGAPVDAVGCAAFLARQLPDVRAGLVGSRSDRVYGSPAITRMREWLLGLDTPA